MIITDFDFDLFETWGGYFKGIAYRNKDGSVSLDVFDVYKVDDVTFLVKENGVERFKGGIFDCIKYCKTWL